MSLWAATAAAILVLTGGAYWLFMTMRPPTVVTAVQSHAVEKLTRAMDGHRNDDALVDEKKRLEEVAQRKADAAAKKQADEALAQTQAERQKADEEAARQRIEAEKQLEKLNQSIRVAEEERIKAQATRDKAETDARSAVAALETQRAQAKTDAAAKPAETLSKTCHFTVGPRAGHVVDFEGILGSRPGLVGTPCLDGMGSTGRIVSPSTPGAQRLSQQPMSLTCQFIAGPRSGQTINYQGVLNALPGRVGTSCRDGADSTGVLVPTMSLICQFTSGPRSGQTINYKGVSGALPGPVGTSCSDGAGSTGVLAL